MYRVDHITYGVARYMYRGDVRATWPQSKISTSGQSRGRAAKCLLAAVAHVKEAVLVLVRVVYTSHQASCGYTLHHHYQSNQVLFQRKETTNSSNTTTTPF